MKYGIWLDEWFSNYVKPANKTKTCERYSEIIEKHLKAKLKDYSLEELTPIVLQKYVSELTKSGNLVTGKGLSPSSVGGIITVIQSSLKVAYMLGTVAEYTANKIKRPKMQEKQVSCFTASEQKKIEKAILTGSDDKLYGILICLYTGIRIGELLALEWDDLDFTKGTLTVSKTCHDCFDEGSNLKRITDTPKTISSRRTIPLPKQIIPLLKEQKKKTKSLYVVSNKEGKPIFVRSYQRNFEALLKRLKIQKKGFHSLRHTFATRALECGMDVKTLSEILGHKNATVTLNRYAHSLMEHKREMMNKVGKLFC